MVYIYCFQANIYFNTYIWRKLGHKRNLEENMFLRLCRIAADNHCLDHYICLLRIHWMEGEACNRFFSLSLFIACIDNNHFPLDILFTLKKIRDIQRFHMVSIGGFSKQTPNSKSKSKSKSNHGNSQTKSIFA